MFTMYSIVLVSVTTCETVMKTRRSYWFAVHIGCDILYTIIIRTMISRRYIIIRWLEMLAN